MVHKGWHSRNDLPHFDSQDVVQFVTFRLADSLPSEALARLRDVDRQETARHEMLDKGWGACWLRAEPIARLVEEAFLAFDGARYRMHAWTIMPNHVHVLFSVIAAHPLGEIVGSWKRFTARKANEHLGRSGSFWQTEYWIASFETISISALRKNTSTRIRSRPGSSPSLGFGLTVVLV